MREPGNAGGNRSIVTGVARTRPGSWTLRTKIIASVVVLFTVVTLATGIGTVLLSRRYLIAQLDSALIDNHRRVLGPDAALRANPAPNGIGAPPPDRRANLGAVPPDAGAGVLHLEFDRPPADQPENTRPGNIQPGRGVRVVVDPITGRQANYAVTNDGAATQLSAAQIRQLATTAVENRPTSINLGGDLGDYRVIESTRANGTVVITGLREAGVTQFVRRMILFVAGGIVIGLLLVVLGGAYFVRRSLAPLNRVAATARRVASMQLTSGEIDGFERVPAYDADSATEVGQVGTALNQMIDNVEGALQARQASEMRVRRFVADASHELRTPLASIRGYAELSQRSTEPIPNDVRHALARVESESVRMTTLVEDLLLLARLDEGRPLERKPVDLSMLVIEMVGDAQTAHPDHVWSLDLPVEPVTVVGDDIRLHQVVANLLTNAATHTPVGTEVLTSLRVDGSVVTMDVVDNGPGIPSELANSVFERFTRGDDSRSRASGSTGLGLSIVAAVVHAHGGTVEIETRPGRTAFDVRLPVAGPLGDADTDSNRHRDHRSGPIDAAVAEPDQ